MFKNVTKVLFAAALFAVLAFPAASAAASINKIIAYTGSSGANTAEQFYMPMGICYTEGNGLVVADTLNNCIRRVVGSNAVVFAGKTGSRAGYADGISTDAMFNNPQGVAVARDGTVYVTDTGNNVIRRIRGGFVDTVAGGLKEGFANGKGANALFNMPTGIAVSANGDIYIADTLNHCIRKMDAAGNVTLFAGTPGERGISDGEALSARFFEPSGVAVGRNGELYVADSANHTIRVIQNNTVTTLSGRRGQPDTSTGYFEGGFENGKKPMYNYPKGIAAAADGYVYVADTFNHAIRMVSPDGSAVTLTGVGGSGKSYTNYKNAMFSRPAAVAVSADALYAADSLNDTVLKITLDNEIKKGLPAKAELLYDKGVYAYKNEIAVCFNSTYITFVSKPKITYESFRIPLTEFFSAIGASANYPLNAKAIYVTRGTFSITLREGTHFVSDNGVYMLDVNVLADSFPYIVQWYPEYNLLIVEE